MRSCKDCNSTDWETVISGIIWDHGASYNLYQCKKCKRVVCAVGDYMWGMGAV